MNDLKVGFSRLNINPMLDINIAGYFVERKAEGFLDDIEVNAIAYECDGKRAVMICADLCNVKKEIVNPIVEGITKKTGVSNSVVTENLTHGKVPLIKISICP